MQINLGPTSSNPNTFVVAPSALQQNSSYIWKGIHKSTHLIKKRLLLPHWIRFSGEHLALPWIPSIPFFTPTPITLLLDQQLVSELIVLETRQWNWALLHNLFDHDTTFSIQQIHIPFTPIADSIIWAKCPSGKFSIKSAYLADQNAKFTLVPLPLLNGRNYGPWSSIHDSNTTFGKLCGMFSPLENCLLKELLGWVHPVPNVIILKN